MNEYEYEAAKRMQREDEQREDEQHNQTLHEGERFKVIGTQRVYVYREHIEEQWKRQ